MNNDDNLFSKAFKELHKLKDLDKADKEQLFNTFKELGKQGKDELKKALKDDDLLNRLKEMGKQGKNEFKSQMHNDDLKNTLRGLGNHGKRELQKVGTDILDSDFTNTLNHKANEVAFSIGNTIQMISGGLIAAIGAGATTIALANTQEMTLMALIAVLTFLGAAPMVGGTMMVLGARKKAKRKKGEFMEKKILRLASRKNGRITAYELAMNSSLSVEKAKEHLDQMYAKGIMELKVADEGVIVYELRDVLSPASKMNARDFI